MYTAAEQEMRAVSQSRKTAFLRRGPPRLFVFHCGYVQKKPGRTSARPGLE